MISKSTTLLIRFGPRYFPIVHAYNKDLRGLAETVCLELEESVHQGVYAVVGGPNFESVAEINMLRTIGADVVGQINHYLCIFVFED